MNNFFLLLGICCQFLLAIYFVSQAVSRQTTSRLRIQYATTALFFGLFGSFLVYGWQTLGLAKTHPESQQASTKPTNPSAPKTDSLAAYNAKVELYASINEEPVQLK